MKSFPKWLMPLIIIGIVAVVVVSAGKFSDQPTVFMRGSVEISDELKDSAKAMNTMFIVLYDADSEMPMPYGAMKDSFSLDAGETSIGDFILTPARVQIMRPGSPTPKNFRLKVRLDRDGMGGRDQPGDMVGSIERIAYGTNNVKIRIDKVVQ